MTEKSQRHKERMQQRKEIVDAAIARADQDRGVVIVLTGDGKGKSSSGFGTVLRCLGHGYKVAVVQFIKGTWECGEKNFLTESIFSAQSCGYMFAVYHGVYVRASFLPRPQTKN